MLQAHSASSCIYKKSILSQRLDVSQTAVFDYQNTNFRSTNGCTSNCLANIQLLLVSGELNVKINVKVLCALMFVALLHTVNVGRLQVTAMREAASCCLRKVS